MNSFHDSDFLFRQPVNQRIDLPVRGLDQVACQGGFFVRRARLSGSCLCKVSILSTRRAMRSWRVTAAGSEKLMV